MTECCTRIGTCKGLKIGGFILAILALTALMIIKSNPGFFMDDEGTTTLASEALKDSLIIVSSITTAVGSVVGFVGGCEFAKEKCTRVYNDRGHGDRNNKIQFWSPDARKCARYVAYLLLAASMITAAVLFACSPNAAISSSGLPMMGNLKLMLAPSILACVGMGGLVLWAVGDGINSIKNYRESQTAAKNYNVTESVPGALSKSEPETNEENETPLPRPLQADSYDLSKPSSPSAFRMSNVMNPVEDEAKPENEVTFVADPSSSVDMMAHPNVIPVQVKHVQDTEDFSNVKHEIERKRCFSAYTKPKDEEIKPTPVAKPGMSLNPNAGEFVPQASKTVEDLENVEMEPTPVSKPGMWNPNLHVNAKEFVPQAPKTTPRYKLVPVEKAFGQIGGIRRQKRRLVALERMLQ